jgi:hypothetical protein
LPHHQFFNAKPNVSTRTNIVKIEKLRGGDGTGSILLIDFKVDLKGSLYSVNIWIEFEKEC